MSVQPQFLLTRLIRLAGDERDLLAVGKWEEALPIQEEFDECFAQLQSAVVKTPLGPQSANDVARLQHLQSENTQLLEQLRIQAGGELAGLGKVRQLHGYAPLGPRHRPSARYLDESA